MTPSRTLLLIAPAGALVTAFLAIPYVNIVLMSFRAPAQGAPYGEGWSLDGYARFFAEPLYIQMLANTIGLGLVTTAICLVLGYPVAWAIVQAGGRMRALLYAIVLSPLLVGIVVRSYGWTILLGNNGVINRTLRDWGWIDFPLPLMYNETGIVIALAHVFLPFMILPIMGTLQGIDPALSQAARSLGASRTTVFRRVILPLSMPGVQSGCILVFVLALSAYVTPMLIGGMRVKTMTVLVVDTLIDAFRWPFGSALALILAVSGGLVVLLFAALTRPKWR